MISSLVLPTYINIDRPIVSVESIIASIIIYITTFTRRSRLDFFLGACAFVSFLANSIPP